MCENSHAHVCMNTHARVRWEMYAETKKRAHAHRPGPGHRHACARETHTHTCLHRANMNMFVFIQKCMHVHMNLHISRCGYSSLRERHAILCAPAYIPGPTHMCVRSCTSACALLRVRFLGHIVICRRSNVRISHDCVCSIAIIGIMVTHASESSASWLA